MNQLLNEIDNRMTATQIAEFLGVGITRIYYWKNQGKLKMQRSTNGPLYATREEVERFAKGFVRSHERA